MNTLEYCVYVLFSLSDGNLYIGFTTDLARRLEEHAAGKSPSTSFRRPFRLLFCEYHTDKGDAIRREGYLKTTAGGKALKLMLREALAKPMTEAIPPSLTVASGHAVAKRHLWQSPSIRQPRPFPPQPRPNLAHLTIPSVSPVVKRFATRFVTRMGGEDAPLAAVTVAAGLAFRPHAAYNWDKVGHNSKGCLL